MACCSATLTFLAGVSGATRDPEPRSPPQGLQRAAHSHLQGGRKKRKKKEQFLCENRPTLRGREAASTAALTSQEAAAPTAGPARAAPPPAPLSR